MVDVASQAVQGVVEGYREAETNVELLEAYRDLGKAAFELAEAGTLRAEELTSELDRVRAAKAKPDTP